MFDFGASHKPMPNPSDRKKDHNDEDDLSVRLQDIRFASGKMTPREFERHYSALLKHHTALSSDERRRVAAIAKGFMDNDHPGKLLSGRSMSGGEAEEYLGALRESGFSQSQVNGVKEALQKMFD